MRRSLICFGLLLVFGMSVGCPGGNDPKKDAPTVPPTEKPTSDVPKPPAPPAKPPKDSPAK